MNEPTSSAAKVTPNNGSPAFSPAEKKPLTGQDADQPMPRLSETCAGVGDIGQQLPPETFHEKSTQSAAGPDAFANLLKYIAEAREYAVYLATAEVDKVRVKIRRLIMWTILGLVAGLIAVTILVTAAALLLWGLADWLGTALFGSPWAGALLVGGGILGGTFLAGWLGLRKWRITAFRAAQRRYATRQAQQEAQFGRSVRTAASANETHS